MSGKNSQTNELPTIWRVPDELWATIQPLLAELDPAKTTGRPRIDQRAALDALIFRLRSGCQGNQLPQEFPDDSSVHRTMQRWQQVGLFEQIWAGLLRECAELGGVDWEWQSADAWMSKARLGGDLIGRNPTDRGKNGVKKSLLVEASGGPLALALAGAHRHDSKLLAATLEAIVIERPQPSVEQPQHLCLDKAFDSAVSEATVRAQHYVPHIRRIGEEKLDEQGEKRYPARRWVVERTFAWLSKCRALLVRYDKKSSNYLALLQLACALLWFRRWVRLAF